MAEYIDRDEVLEYRETVTTDDYSGNETLDVVAVEEILEVEPVDVVERSKINKGFREIERLVEESMREAPCSEGDYRIGLRKAMATIERYIGE